MNVGYQNTIAGLSRMRGTVENAAATEGAPGYSMEKPSIPSK
jgi:hypothetical protein